MDAIFSISIKHVINLNDPMENKNKIQPRKKNKLLKTKRFLMITLSLIFKFLTKRMLANVRLHMMFRPELIYTFDLIVNQIKT